MTAASPCAPEISVGPHGFAVSAADLDDWVKRARVGATYVYAHGKFPPSRAEGWRRARALYEDGLITLASRRGDGEIEWFAQRLGPRAPRAAHPAPSSAPAQEPKARMLAMLRRCASMGLVCPTNPEFNAYLGVDNGKYLFAQLIADKSISSHDAGPGFRRVVTITATGARTRGGPL